LFSHVQAGSQSLVVLVLADFNFRVQTRLRLNVSGGKVLPKMCGAMDGGAQALMDELEAFFGSTFPPLTTYLT
jgi:hypothetical protein